MAATVKLQYKNFERGEYTEAKAIEVNDLITIIESMPWKEGREHFVVDITTTSVTLENETGNYLKLALYYNQKFILYFFDCRHLSTKSFLNYKDAYPVLTNFLQSGSININEFKKERVFFKNLPSYFNSQSFIYKPKGISYLLSTSPVSFLFSLFAFWMIINMLINFNQQKSFTIPFIILLIMIIIIGGGINIWLYLNYTLNTKNYMLQMSRGHDIFKFSKDGEIFNYDKKDIDKVEIRKNTNTRCAWNSFTLTTIYFNNGSCITIPSNILSGSNIEYKLIDKKPVRINVWIPLLSKIKMNDNRTD